MDVREAVLDLVQRPPPSYVDVSDCIELDQIQHSIDGIIGAANEVLRSAERESQGLNDREFLIYVDFGSAETIVAARSLNDLASMKVERLLLYALNAGDYLNSSGELHAFNFSEAVQLPRRELIFVCFRDAESFREGWEYSVGLFVK